MTFDQPTFSRNDVNKAGAILAAAKSSPADLEWATNVLANWRSAHLLPINSFQKTLRKRASSVDSSAIVAQRLKRAPSVIDKLRRFPTMKLSRMQDIGGLRAVVGSIAQVRELEDLSRGHGQSGHELVNHKDYIAEPKRDGYRSIHLVYRCRYPQSPAFDGLHVEIQLRTRLQHAWATAVETMGTFLGQALKSGQGEDSWRDFFALAGAALAHVEESPTVPGFEHFTPQALYAAVAKADRSMGVLDKLSSFAIATSRISAHKGKGNAYHLVVLDAASRSVNIWPFPSTKLDAAAAAYAEVEARGMAGEKVEAVLVSTGSINSLRTAYPNYFLDTHEFVTRIKDIIRRANGRKHD